MFLEYGVNDHGELVNIDQVGRGRLDGVYCPYCGVGLLAKKGRKLAHHFAHDGETCNPSQRDQDVISLPAFDRFDLGIAPRLLRILHGWPTNASQLDCLQLERAGLVTHNPWSRDYELSERARIVTGDLPLAAFADEQDHLLSEKHQRLETTVKWSTSDQDRALAMTDLKLYRAQWQRVLSATLYFLEIKHGDRTFYKIGVTNRPIDERLAEIAQSLRTHLGEYPTIEPLRVLAHRGAVERYFMHRYSAQQTPIDRYTEYFTFDPRRNVLSDLTRLGEKELSDIDRAVLAGDFPPVIDDQHKIAVTPESDHQDDPPDPVTVLVYDDRRMVYTRKVDLKEYTITCKQCGETVTLWRYPGRAPTLCSETCQREYERERDRAKTRERVKRHRERKRKSTR